MKIIVENSDNERLDLYLAEYFDDITRSQISKLIKSNNVLVNNNKVKSSYLVNDDDEIFINLKELEIKPLEKENLNLEIVYKDDDILIINKPGGIIAHPTNSIRSNTVVNHLLYLYDNLPSINGEERPGIVHRLDKDTSGLMVIALNEESMIKLKEMFKNREIIKKYRAIVNHPFTELDGTINLPIGRNPNDRKLMAVIEDGKQAITDYKVLEQNQEYAYLDINLHTGRTHQIRVHLSHINHPILGDRDYNKIKNKFNISGQLLQAYYLEFNHPTNNERIKVEIPQYPEFSRYCDLIFEKI